MEQVNKLDCLDKEFLEDYRKLVQDFDAIDKDLFQGYKLETLVKDFLKKHRKYIDSFPFEAKYKFPNCSYVEIMEEDFRIINEDNKQKPELTHRSPVQHLMGDIFRRASQGSYLRLTYNKARLDKEEDRLEPMEFARYAIRYDSSDFLIAYWYMICLGWYLNSVTNAKERVHLARLFHHSALRSVRLNPEHPLGHHLIGRYNYSIAGLSWIERTAAKGLLGVKVEGSYQEAERAFLRCEQLKRGWMPTGLWMARVLLAQQRPKDEVKHWIDYGLSLIPSDPTSEIERRELLELQAKLKFCSN